MSDYIKREDVLALKGNCYDKDGHLLYAVGTGDIMRIPSADVVEVVRCKDCIHNGQCKHRVVMWVEDPINTWHKDDVVRICIDFCSYGERKEK